MILNSNPYAGSKVSCACVSPLHWNSILSMAQSLRPVDGVAWLNTWGEIRFLSEPTHLRYTWSCPTSSQICSDFLSWISRILRFYGTDKVLARPPVPCKVNEKDLMVICAALCGKACFYRKMRINGASASNPSSTVSILLNAANRKYNRNLINLHWQKEENWGWPDK